MGLSEDERLKQIQLLEKRIANQRTELAWLQMNYISAIGFYHRQCGRNRKLHDVAFKSLLAQGMDTAQAEAEMSLAEWGPMKTGPSDVPAPTE